MSRWNAGRWIRGAAAAVAVVVGVSAMAEPPEVQPGPVVLVVMDPLASELACACVRGYGQRNYRKLAARLESVLKVPVGIEFSDDLAETLSWVGPERQVIVVGERSVAAKGAASAGLKCHPICELTGQEGHTSISGTFVTRADDPARALAEIGGRQVLFGLAESRENLAALQAALRDAGVEAGGIEARGAYSDAALDVLDSTAKPPPVAVIPDYALRLLEGCGSVKPGELRVIGSTPSLPFITVFLADDIPQAQARTILDTLLNLKEDETLLRAMESRDGFKPVDTGEPEPQRTSAASDWPDWRGPGRDGRVAWLPARLPATPRVVWKKAAMPASLAGLSVSDGRLILAERDFGDERDVYRCLNADDGRLLWRIEFPAPGQLDYGQSPRATPVIHEGRAYLLGAFGELRCVDVVSGAVLWKRNLPREFGAELPTWGLCSTPLVVDGMLVVNPGGPGASLAALDCANGATRWETPGPPAAYASFICGDFGGRRQIVGYDEHSLGGWDVQTGERLWQLLPPTEGDFNVPTPIAVEGGILIATENNGTRFHRFDTTGRIIHEPASSFAELAPDTATPVVTCGRVFGAYLGLRCLDLRNGLQPVWRHDEDLGDYATFIADDQHVLVITVRGELILLDARADTDPILSRLRVFEEDVEVYSHPALVGTRLYLRGGSSVVCVDLESHEVGRLALDPALRRDHRRNGE